MEISAILMGQRVRSARKAKEMSTEELAEKVGVAVESIGHIECGARKPSLNLLYNIAEVLGVSLDYLTGRTENSSDALLHECADSNDLTGEQEQMLLELCRSMIPIIKKSSKIIKRDCTLNYCPIPRTSFFIAHLINQLWLINER